MEKLSSIPVTDCYPERSIHYLHDSDKVCDAIRFLSEHDIYSAPVLSLNNEVVAVMDFAQLVQFAVTTSEELDTWGHDRFYSFLEHSERMSVTPIRDLLKKEKKQPAYIYNDASMANVIKEMSSNELKRLFVIDRNGKILNIITQSSLMDFICDHDEWFRHILNAELSKFNINRNVVSVKKDENVIEAFKLMKENKISAVCVTDRYGYVIDTISVKDLRTVVPGLTIMQRLFIPIEDFLNRIEVETKKKRELIVCSENDTVRNVLEKIRRTRVHRVWMLSHGKANGVVSLKDILEIICRS